MNIENSKVFIIIILVTLVIVTLFLNRKKNVTIKYAELDKNKENDLSNITEIVLQNSLGNEIAFKKVTELSEIKYQEVILGEVAKIGDHMIQASMPFLERTSTLAEITKNAPNGLFKASVDPSSLSKFKDGTTSTMVRDGKNNLVKHAGFESLENIGGKINPLTIANVGMQSMAMISGQYYLHQIFDYLENIDLKLEKLIQLHNDEKSGILINAKKRLIEITCRNNVDNSDIIEIRELRNKIGEVFQEYKTRLDREIERVAEFKATELFVEKRVDAYIEKIEELSFTIQICFESDALSIQSELAEIALRMKLNYMDNMIEELLCQLKHNYTNSFSVNIDSIMKESMVLINENAKNIVRNGKDFIFIDRNSEKLLNTISDRYEQIGVLFDSRYFKNVIDKVLEDRFKKQEIIIMPNEDLSGQRVFIG